MATEFFIPKLGQTVEEVTIVKWLVADGTKVNQGDAILEVETDKAVFPVEANAKGYIHRGSYKEGDVVPVLTIVAVIGKEGDLFSTSDSTHSEEGRKSIPVLVSDDPLEETITSLSSSHQGNVNKRTTISTQGRIFASPRAKKAAFEKNVDLMLIQPSGGGGMRITEKDVLGYITQTPKATPVAQKVAAESGVDLHLVAGTGPGGRIIKEDVERATKPTSLSPSSMLEIGILERLPLKGVRGIIAERMGTSVRTTARVTLVIEVDATEFVNMRNRLKVKVSEDWGFTPGYNDLLGKVVAAALRKFPYMNARLTTDAIEHLAQINIGMAVDTERGLLVPVIRDADQKSLSEFGNTFRQLVERARQGRSLPDDLSGGTFTITNLGMYDIDAFTPVINLPEAAILGVGRIAPKPVIRGESVVIRQMWTLSLVFDHRLVDGAPAARFLQYIKELIEEPYLLVSA